MSAALRSKAGIHLEPLLACLPQGRRQAGQVPGHSGGRVQPPALPERVDLQDQDRRRRLTPHHAQSCFMYWDSGAYADYAVNVTRASAYSAGAL